jgi:hypothetical protein
VADDFEEPDGTHVLTFHQAGDAGKALARGKADTADSKPMTVADALARYKIDLKSRGGHLSNATRVEKHLERLSIPVGTKVRPKAPKTLPTLDSLLGSEGR